MGPKSSEGWKITHGWGDQRTLCGKIGTYFGPEDQKRGPQVA